jgi:glucose-6-phosphate dehydrogenase assembly protein OpcA
MAAAVVDRTWRTSTPDTVERDLGRLWRDVAAKGRVARAVMSNLVVFRGWRTAPPRRQPALQTDPVLEAVVARHPSRVVLIEHEQQPDTVAGPVAASVGVAVFGSPAARYGVEQIAVRSSFAEDSLPSIVRCLVRGSLPTSVWWREDVSSAAPFAAIAELGRQLLYDSRSWGEVRQGVQLLAPLTAARRVDLADPNWRRLTPLRLGLVHAAQPDRPEIAGADVRIIHRPGEGVLAWLLAGWLASRLQWTAADWPRIDEGRPDAETLSVTIGGAAAITATLDEHRALVRRSSGAPLVVGVPHEGEAEAIARELRVLSTDPGLHEALTALAGRFSRSGG